MSESQRQHFLVGLMNNLMLDPPNSRMKGLMIDKDQESHTTVENNSDSESSTSSIDNQQAIPMINAQLIFIQVYSVK